MIWPELWCFVLAVVLNKRRTKRWIGKNCSRAALDYSDPHRYADLTDGHLRRCDYKGPPMRCACPACVSEFDRYFEWVRIG